MDPVDVVELREGLRNMASLTRTFYLALKDEGFTTKEALMLTATWLASIQKMNTSDDDG